MLRQLVLFGFIASFVAGCQSVNHSPGFGGTPLTPAQGTPTFLVALAIGVGRYCGTTFNENKVKANLIAAETQRQTSPNHIEHVNRVYDRSLTDYQGLLSKLSNKDQFCVGESAKIALERLKEYESGKIPAVQTQ